MSKKIKLFACCIPVKGPVKSIICDIQRNDYDEIPNSLCDLLMTYDGYSIEEIKTHYPIDEHQIIDEYLDFLQEKQYIFYTETPNSFPPLSLQWDAPQWITNAIIDTDSQSAYSIEDTIAQLSTLRCVALELRFFDPVPFTFIETLLLQTQHSSLRSVSLMICYNTSTDIAAAEALFLLPAPLTNVMFHSHDGKAVTLTLPLPIFTTPVRVEDETHCGVISPYNFVVNTSLFTESQHFNNCLNRKISVDRQGFIKNCPSCSQTYGHVKDTSLANALEQPKFRQVWAIKKDDIEVCRDCEYRYICVDCRAYQRPDNLAYGKPVKCQYDPYTATYNEPL